MGTCSSKQVVKTDPRMRVDHLDNVAPDQNVKKEFSKLALTVKGSQNGLSFSVGDLVSEQRRNINKNYTFTPTIIHTCLNAEIKLAISNTTKKTFAVKIINKKFMSMMETHQALREIYALKNIDHGNIVRLHDIYESRFFYYLVRDYVEGETLTSVIISGKGFFNEVTIRKIVKSLLGAVSYLHQNELVHGKIERDKVIYSKTGDIVLVGFGAVATSKSDTSKTENTSNIQYRAPETFEGMVIDKSDVWSVGIILHELLTGSYPFNGDSNEIKDKILKGELDQPLSSLPDVSNEAKSILAKLLTFDYKKRPSALDLLNMEWFNCDDTKLESRFILTKYINNAKNIDMKSKLQEAILMYFTMHMTSHEERSAILKKFEIVDSANDGMITKAELQKKILSLGLHYSSEEIDSIFSKLDKNGQGYISLSEFSLGMVNHYKLLQMTNIVAVFKQFDVNNTGKINVNNFKKLFSENKDFLSANWDEQLRQIDLDGDGFVEFIEFRIFVENILKNFEDKKE